MDDSDETVGAMPVLVEENYQFPLSVEQQKHDLQIKQTAALETLASSVQCLARFVSEGGLTEVLSAYARTNSVNGILGGLASSMGRSALDARTIGQNALEITEAIEAVFDKFAQRAQAKQSGEKRDPEIHDPEASVRQWYSDGHSGNKE